MAGHVGRVDHDAHRHETAALGGTRRGDQRFGAGGGRARRSSTPISSARRYRLLHRRHGYARLLLSGDGLSGRARARRQRQARVRHRDRVQRLHLRPDGRISLVRSGVYQRVMLIGAETLSKIINIAGPLDGDPVRRRRRRGDPRNRCGRFVSCLRTRRRRQPSRDCSTFMSSGSRNPIDHAALDARRNFDPHAGARSLQVRRHQDDRSDRLGAGKGEPRKSRRHILDPASSQQTHHRRGGATTWICPTTKSSSTLTSMATPRRPRSRWRFPRRFGPVASSRQRDRLRRFRRRLSWGAVAWRWSA